MTAPHSPPASPSRPPLAASPSTHASIPYSSDFASSLGHTILNPSNHDSPTTRIIRITPSTSSSSSPSSTNTTTTSNAHANTIPITSIAFSTLPIIPPSDLPLPLSDSRRVYESSLSGVRLTHPGGWLEGGASSNAPASARAFRIALSEAGRLQDAGVGDDHAGGVNGGTVTAAAAAARTDNVDAEREGSMTYTAYLSSLISPLLASPNTTTTTQQRITAIRAALAEETEAQLEELRRRMRAREEAVRKNEEIESKLAELEAQRRIERRVEEGWRRRGKV